MSGMLNMAQRLVEFAHNKVVHIKDVNPMYVKLMEDDRALAALRLGLKMIDDQYEILIPRRVDDEERQLKRYIQWNYGTKVNLTTLRMNSLKYYLKLYDYGSPADVVEGWGLEVVYSTTLTEKNVLEAVEALRNDEGKVVGLYRDAKLYKSVKYYAKQAGQSVSEYLNERGVKYGKEA